MAEMSSWDRLAHWTFSSLENLVGTGQGTGTVFGPPKGATWADWRNNDNWAQPGEPGGVPVEYTGGGTADTGVPLDSRWLEVNPKSDMIAPNQQVYIGPGARKPDWPGARKPWIDPNTGRPWDPSVESGAPRPTWVDPDTRQPFNPGGGGPAGPAGGPGGGVVVTPLGPRPIVTGTPYVGPGGVGTQGGDPFTEADNMPRDTAPANWDRGPQDRPLGAGDWRNDPSQDPFPRRQPGSNIQINPSGKPWDPNWAPSSSWGMPEHRIGGGSIRRIDYPSLKKELQDRKQMYLDMFGRREIGHEELAREIAEIEPKMQEVLHWEKQQAWDAQQRELHAELRDKFRGWSAAQIREWMKNNPNFLGQGDPGFWQRYGKKPYGAPSARRYSGPDSPAFDRRPPGGTVMRDEVIEKGSTRYPVLGTDQLEEQWRTRADVRAEVAAEADYDQTMSTAADMQGVEIQNMIMDYADSVIDEDITLDEVDPDFRAWVEQEIAKRKAALKRA